MAVALTGGIPRYAHVALMVFVFLGLLQSAISLLAFIGLQKVGASRSQPLRNSYPLWSAAIAIAFKDEHAGLALLGAVPFTFWGRTDHRLVWHRRGVMYFFWSGFFEALRALLTLVALASGRFVIVSPIVATTPLFSLIISLVFLRGKEQVTGKTRLGTIAVVFGTIAIALGK